MRKTNQTVGIVTFFKSQNYGVWLQAYATEKALEKLGCYVEMIDYTNLLEGNRKNKSGVKKLMNFMKSLVFGGERYYRQGFLSQIHNYYNLSNCSYHNTEEMQEITYDILVAGSDQIWNPETTSGKLDLTFLLQFGNATKRMSVASSIGSKAVKEEDKETFRKAFEQFNGISVREEFAKEQLQCLTDTSIKVVCDPTVLLERKEWLQLASQSTYDISGPYILTYFVSTKKRSGRYQKCISDYASSRNLPVWSVQFSTYKNNPCEKIIAGATVADFVKLIANAELVITDSFHGVAMSVNLNTRFVAIENQENPVRVKNFLEKLDLENRINLVPSKDEKIDYEQVNSNVQQMRNEAMEWITEIIDS